MRAFIALIPVRGTPYLSLDEEFGGHHTYLSIGQSPRRQYHYDGTNHTSCSPASATPRYPARQPSPADLLLGRRLPVLHRLDAPVVRELRCRNLGLLSHAQPCSPDCGPGRARFAVPGHRGGSSTIHEASQLPGRLARPSLAGAVCLVCDAGRLPAGLCPVH